MPGMPHLPVGDAPLTGIGPIFKPCFHPPFYFAPAQLLSQLPHSARAGVSLSHGMALWDAAAQLRAWLSQGSPQDWVGWGGTDWGCLTKTQCPEPSPCLFAVSDILQTCGSWMGHRLGSLAKPFGSQLPQQHRVSGLSTQTRWTQIVFPFLTALGWQICGGERSGLTLSRLSIFLIQNFCCQPGILK